ncbi:MAG: DUF11 domain-containing protein [Chloroflexi bacterium]|nr:DUF11 domain-containing protein [Chloroflexota bacterium]
MVSLRAFSLAVKLGNVVSPRITANGIATSAITSTLPGTAHITATTNSRTGTTSVVFAPGAPYTMTLAADPASLTVDSSSTLTATVTDQFGNFIVDGTSVAFATSLGNVFSPRPTTNGIATSTLASTLVGTAQVTATSGSATQSTAVVFAPGAPFDITVQADPAILVADGSTSSITATVRDQFNNLVADGTSVNFSAFLGTVGTPRPTSNGLATTTFTSGVLSGTAIVTATTNGRSGSANLTLLQAVVDLSTSVKTASAQIVKPTELLTYTIVLSNTGNTLGAGLTLTDAIPFNTTYVTSSLSGAGAAYNAALNQIEWTGSIPQDGSVTLSYVVAIQSTAHSAVLNTAYVFIQGVLDRTLEVSTSVRSLIYLPLIVNIP